MSRFYQPYGGGLRDALPLTLRINSTTQRVGETPVYTLVGAQPGATVLWSSFQNGKDTGEFESGYSQTVESNGTAQLTASAPWTEADIGNWIKIALVQTADGQNPRAVAQFQVLPAATAPPAGSAGVPMAASGNFFSDPLFSLGSYEVTGGMALLGLAGFWLVFKKK